MITHAHPSRPSGVLYALVICVTLGSCDESSTGPDSQPVPAAVSIVAGEGQSGVVGSELPQPIVAKVVDANGRGIPGQPVSVRVTSGGGSIITVATMTNSEGLVEVRWKLGTSSAVSQRIEVQALRRGTAEVVVAAEAYATPLPGPAVSLVVEEGNEQTGDLASPLAVPLAIRAADQYDNAVPGFTVAWSVEAGGGSIAPATGPTDLRGRAKATWVLGNRLDAAHVATASAGSLAPARFTATPRLPAGATVSREGDTPLTAFAGTALPEPVVVRVRLADGRPVQGASVAWTVASGGGAVSDAVVVTDNEGRARARWTLGTSLGAQTMNVTVSGLAPLTLTATALAGVAKSVVVISGNGQSAAAGAALADPLIVSVRDINGNPIAAVNVTWKVTAGGGSVVPTAATTDAEGKATARWTLGTTAGANAITVEVTDIAPAVFNANGVAGPVARIEKTGDGQRAAIRATLPVPIVARVVDQYGNPIAGVSVAWTVEQGGGSVSATSSTTDGDGRASTQWTLGPAEGEQRLTATAGTVATTYTATALPASGEVQLALQEIASGLEHPLYLTTTPIDDRLFVVEQTGRILIIKDGQLLATPFLDVNSKLSFGGERGLLSMAFHPQYASNGFLYIAYTDVRGDVRLERYKVSGNPDVVDWSSAKPILVIEHRMFFNHNGGLVKFGADGMLYMGVGDGGGNLDANAQNLGVLLGKLLRLDVDGEDPYAIPVDNPFYGRTDVRPEIWAYGLRNPWRWSFDGPTDRLYLADVGQADREEVNAVGARVARINYGWNIMEGFRCYSSSNCNQTGLQLPVIDYDHTQGCSVTGGYVYRGADIPEISGHYFYSDFCGGWLRSFRLEGGAAADQKEWWPANALSNVTSFGVDRRGEIYIVASGKILKLVRGN